MLSNIATPVRVERDKRTSRSSQAYDVLDANGKYILTRVSKDLARRYTLWANNFDECVGALREIASDDKRREVFDLKMIARALLDRIEKECEGEVKCSTQ